MIKSKGIQESVHGSLHILIGDSNIAPNISLEVYKKIKTVRHLNKAILVNSSSLFDMVRYKR